MRSSPPVEISASFLKREATVVTHGVDTERYAPPPDRAAAFAEAGLPGRYAIGCFGRVRAQKGTDVFVAAMCRLLPRFPDFTAVIVGQITPEQTGFANDLKQQDRSGRSAGSRIVITGELPIDEVAALVSAADDLCLHLAQRGFWADADRGDVGWRGAGGGARRRGGDSWSRTASPACWCRPAMRCALSAALEPLMREPSSAQAMGERGRARVLEKFSLDAEASAIAAVYKTLV